MSGVLVTLVLIALHTVDGVEILINPDEIAVLRPSSEAAKGKPNSLIVGGVRCVIGLTTGKFVSVVETCPTVRDAINATDFKAPGALKLPIPRE
jgi:hypothetical protein